MGRPRAAPVILGAGALGRWMGWLWRDRHPILVGRRRPPGPLRFQGPDGRCWTWEPEVVGWEAPLTAVPEWVLVAVKWPGMEAVRHWLGRWHPLPRVLTVLNGMGQEEALAGVAPAPARLNVGVTTAACTLAADGRVLVASAGETVFRAGQEWAAIADAARALGIPWRFAEAEEVWRLRWRKLAQNAVINPLTALASVPNGQLPASPLWRLAPAILEECRLAAELAGAAPAEDWLPQVEALCRQTAANWSSMVQDLRRGRPTEVGAINGFVVRWLAGKGRPAPVNAALWALIQVLEKGGDQASRARMR